MEKCGRSHQWRSMNDCISGDVWMMDDRISGEVWMMDDRINGEIGWMIVSMEKCG